MNEEKRMSDEELYKAIERKYGEEWNPRELSTDDPLIAEFWRRIAKAR